MKDDLKREPKSQKKPTKMDDLKVGACEQSKFVTSL